MSKHFINPNKWIDKYSDYLFNFTISRVNDREKAKDLVQDTFFAALKSMKNFKGEASERTWLISILKRKIIDHYRKINSIKGKAEIRVEFNNEDDEGSWLEKRVADTDYKTAEDTIINNELGEAIYNCLSKLPPKQATVFRLKPLKV